jgi:hypothetical protein
MPRAKADADEVVETNGDGGSEKGMRVSITIDPSLRRHMRIAAALNDMTVGEWAVATLTRAANKASETTSAE